MSSGFLNEFFRLPEGAVPVHEDPSTAEGFFQLENKVLCFGGLNGLNRHRSPAESPRREMFAGDDGDRLTLTFNATAAANNLRLERYADYAAYRSTGPALVNSAYYSLRPWLPVSLRRQLQRFHFRGWDKHSFPNWPVDTSIEDLANLLLLRSMERLGLERVPFIWFWPEGYHDCLVLTHDVEGPPGLRSIPDLVALDHSFDIPCSVHLMREGRYEAPLGLIDELKARGVEVNVHGLNHDGRLFSDRRLFEARAQRINEFGRQIGARGFRSPVMYRNPDWFDLLDFEYDMSFPNVARLDPQQGGCCTVFPYRIGEMLEIPLTTTQDYALFNLLNDYRLDLWEQQIRTLQRHHGLLSFNTHPDYLLGSKPRALYERLLDRLRQLVTAGQTWSAKPAELNDWWRERERSKICLDGPAPRVESESGRARLAWAVRDDDGIRYEHEQGQRPGR